MNKILLIGSGGHAKSCIEVIEQEGNFKIVGLISNQKISSSIELPILGTDDDLEKLYQSIKYAFITIGQIKTPKIRSKLFIRLLSIGFKFPVIKSPMSYVSKRSEINMGSIIMTGTIINASVKIGNNCIINNKSLIEHDSIIGDHCHISTGAIINGGVKVGAGTFIGSGVTTKEGISIGKNCIIGVGSTIKKDIPDNQTFTN